MPERNDPDKKIITVNIPAMASASQVYNFNFSMSLTNLTTVNPNFKDYTLLIEKAIVRRSGNVIVKTLDNTGLWTFPITITKGDNYATYEVIVNPQVKFQNGTIGTNTYSGVVCSIDFVFDN